jgi:hypothetical protein
MRGLKFFLLSSVIGAIIWLVLTQASLHSRIILSNIVGNELGMLISVMIIVTFGSYLSLWIFGKLKDLKITHGVIVGIFSFIFILAIDIISSYYLISELYSIPSGVTWSLIRRELPIRSLRILIGSIVGGFLGVFIIRRGAPVFSPHAPQMPQPRTSKNWIKIITTFAVGLICLYFAGGFFYALGYPISEGGRWTATWGGPTLLIFGLFLIGIGLYDLLKKK